MSDTQLKVLAASSFLLFLGLVTLIAGTHSGEAELLNRRDAVILPQEASSSNITTDDIPIAVPRRQQPVTSQTQAEGNPATTACPNQSQKSAGPEEQTQASNPTKPVPSYFPKQGKALAHPTNYGERFARDLYGRPVSNQYIVVLHETVASAGSTIQFFQTPHYKDNQQFSYHTLVTLDGTVVYLVPPEKRAYGAGNSIFAGANGPEAVKTNLNLPPSVNNFAYHISLETPADGNNNRARHSGYTEAQYQSLAWLVARTQVPDARITTHKAVDRSGDRFDPRSFNSQKFLALLHTYPRTPISANQC